MSAVSKSVTPASSAASITASVCVVVEATAEVVRAEADDRDFRAAVAEEARTHVPTLLEARAYDGRAVETSLRLPRRAAPQRHDAARATACRAPRDQRLLGHRACRRTRASICRPSIPPAKVYGGPGRFGFAPESHVTESSPLVSRGEAREGCSRSGRRTGISPGPLLLEKSPPNLLKTRFLQALFPGSAFVVIVRHPIPVSIPTARWRGTRRYDRMFEHWLRCHELFEADREHLERVHVLTYEQLVRDPDGVLRGIFEFLELDPIAPSEPVEGGANEKYFRQWQGLKRDLRMRAYLDLVSRAVRATASGATATACSSRSALPKELETLLPLGASASSGSSF